MLEVQVSEAVELEPWLSSFGRVLGGQGVPIGCPPCGVPVERHRHGVADHPIPKPITTRTPFQQDVAHKVAGGESLSSMSTGLPDTPPPSLTRCNDYADPADSILMPSVVARSKIPLLQGLLGFPQQDGRLVPRQCAVFACPPRLDYWDGTPSEGRCSMLHGTKASRSFFLAEASGLTVRSDGFVLKRHGFVWVEVRVNGEKERLAWVSTLMALAQECA